MTTKWRIYCTQPGDEGWHSIWSDTAPTTCPNDPAHSVNPNSVNVVAVEREQFRVSPSFASISKSNNFQRVATFEYDPVFHGELRRVKLISNIDDVAGNYDLELYNVSTRTTLSTNNFANSNPDNIQTTSAISPALANKSLIEVNVKKSAGHPKSQVSIFEIIVYGDR